MNEFETAVIKLFSEINAKLDALYEQGENHEEDLRQLYEKVEAMDTSYGSGVNIEDYGVPD